MPTSLLKAGGEGDDRGWAGWMASPTQWTWVWVKSGSWWWTGKPGMLRFMGCKELDTTELLNWTELSRRLESTGHHSQHNADSPSLWLFVCAFHNQLLLAEGVKRQEKVLTFTRSFLPWYSWPLHQIIQIQGSDTIFNLRLQIGKQRYPAIRPSIKLTSYASGCPETCLVSLCELNPSSQSRMVVV